MSCSLKEYSKRPLPPRPLLVDTRVASSQVTQQLQFQVPIYSQSQSQSELYSPQEKRQSQPLCTTAWSAHAPRLQVGQPLSPFLRQFHALSTSATATGELFLFGGYVHRSWSPNNDLYAISTRDFSTTLLRTSGDVPNPRYGHHAVLTDTTLLIWGGRTDFRDQNAQNQSNDDSFYLLNLVSREWTRIIINGPGPGGRYYHTMTLVGSKLFVFGGWSATRCLNDMWALDLNCLKSNPFWESYEPAPGNKKPFPRSGHVAVTTGDRIIIFGGCGGPHIFNDTWSFDISTRKWTELQCTGTRPSPRASHAAVLIEDDMYVFGGRTVDKTNLGDLTAFNVSTQRWTAFQDVGSSPGGRGAHAMASDGRRVFVLGGALSPGAQVDDAKLIHVLDTKLLNYPKSHSNTVRHGEKTTQLAQKPSTGHPTQGLPQHRILSSSDARAAQCAFPFQIATSEHMDGAATPRITREKNFSLYGPPLQPTGVDDKSRCVLQEFDDSENLTTLMTPAASEKEVVWLGHGRLIAPERQLSATFVGQTEREQRIAQLTDELVQKNAQLEQAEATVAEVTKRAGLEQRRLQAILDELLLSRDKVLEQAQSATFRAANAIERSQRELAEVHAKVEAMEFELAAVRLRLTDAEVGWAKSKAEADILRAGTQAAAGFVNMDVDRVMRRLMERVRSVEVEMASLRGNEKSIEEMECRNEG